MFLVAAAVLAGGSAVAFGAPGGAQSDDLPVELLSVGLPAEPEAVDNIRPALSDTGAVVAFVSIPTASGPEAAVDLETVDETPADETPADETPADETPADQSSTDELPAEETLTEETPLDETSADARVWIRDRTAETTRPVAELGSGAPAISGNGCLVAYVVTVDVPDPEVSLTTVDRCTADPSALLPIGQVVDTVPATTGIPAAPAVSFDGSTIVWSTGDEIRRYVRDETTTVHELSDAFDADFVPTPGVRTGERVDVSADGRTVAFVAGPGDAPFTPDVGNVYVWSQPDEEPATIELLSFTSAGLPGAAPSGAPTISADGALVAFESVSTDLVVLEDGTPVTPFIVLVDRPAGTTGVVAEYAQFPALSADGSWIVHQRANDLRLLTLDADDAAEERFLAAVEPDGPAAISRHGRWIVFASAAPLVEDDTDSGADVWAADLRPADDGDPADTTSTTVAPAPTTTDPAPPTSDPAPTTTDAAPATTAAPTNGSGTTPTTTVASQPVFPRVTTSFPTFRPSTTSSQASSTTLGGAFLTATATPIRFEPTIVDAGRRTATTTLTAGRATTIASVEVPSGPFAVATDSCTGLSLPAGGSCTVDVDFRPDTVGPVTGFLTFRLDDGSVTSAQLDGEGSAEPTLDIVPSVATPGQVVTVFGAGFPAGAIVELQDSTESHEVTVDVDGTFAHVLVVMPHTPAGPLDLVVVGQLDSFADVTGELLVSNRNVGTGSAAFRDSIVTGLGR